MGRIIFLIVVLVSMTACGSSSGGSRGDVRYVAIGASDATGIGATPITNGYVYRLRTLLEEAGWNIELRNLGIPGARVREMREIELPLATRSNPSLVTIFAGGNDLVQGVEVDDFERDLAEILDELNSDPVPVISIATVPDMTRLPRFQEEPDRDVTVARVSAFNEVIRRQATRVNAIVADLGQFELDADVTAGDGFHPNDRGHELIADKFFTQVQGPLADRGEQ